jgi:hypothetical protein
MLVDVREGLLLEQCGRRLGGNSLVLFMRTRTQAEFA